MKLGSFLQNSTQADLHSKYVTNVIALSKIQCFECIALIHRKHEVETLGIVNELGMAFEGVTAFLHCGNTTGDCKHSLI